MFNVAKDRHYYVGPDAIVAVHPTEHIPVLMRKNGELSKLRLQYILDTTGMELDISRGVGIFESGEAFYYLKPKEN